MNIRFIKVEINFIFYVFKYVSIYMSIYIYIYIYIYTCVCKRKLSHLLITHRMGTEVLANSKEYKYFPWSYLSWIQYLTGKHNPRCVWRLSPSPSSINIKLSARRQPPDVATFRRYATFQANNSAQTLKLSRCCTLVYSTCCHLTFYTSQRSTFTPFHIYHKDEQHSLQGFRAVNISFPSLHIINVTAPTLHSIFPSFYVYKELNVK
jgi:hypothetical protein